MELYAEPKQKRNPRVGFQPILRVICKSSQSLPDEPPFCQGCTVKTLLLLTISFTENILILLLLGSLGWCRQRWDFRERLHLFHGWGLGEGGLVPEDPAIKGDKA